MDEELRFHLEQLHATTWCAPGVPPDEAARRARIEFGSVDNVKADCRQARGLGLLDELAPGPALRRCAACARRPGFTARPWRRWRSASARP